MRAILIFLRTESPVQAALGLGLRHHFNRSSGNPGVWRKWVVAIAAYERIEDSVWLREIEG